MSAITRSRRHCSRRTLFSYLLMIPCTLDPMFYNDIDLGPYFDRDEANLAFFRKQLRTEPSRQQFDRATVLREIARALRGRFDQFGDANSMLEAERYHQQLCDLPEEELEAPPLWQGVINLLRQGAFNLLRPRSHSQGCQCGLNLADFRERLEHLLVVLKSTSPTNSVLLRNHEVELTFLCAVLRHSGEEQDTSTLIATARCIISICHRRGDHPGFWICTLLACRLQQTERFEDFHEFVPIFETGFKIFDSKMSMGYHAAELWSTFARACDHPSAARAYEALLTTIQHKLESGPTLQAQRIAIGYLRGAKPQAPTLAILEYASYLIEKSQLESAVQILEQGRSLLWSRMRGLRASVEELRAVDPELANRYIRVSHERELVNTTSDSLHQVVGDPSSAADGSFGEGEEIEDPFGRTYQEHLKVSRERQAVISQIRAIPGFETFLVPSPFLHLRSAASNGPIIFIHHCKWRCDILILLPDATLHRISTAYDTFARANSLSDLLLDTRSKYGLDSKKYDQALRIVLEVLYEIVGQPVIQELRRLGTPEQSRVWGYPTSVFCSLPLHAMGPIPPSSADNRSERYFCDVYVCSYTPTLGALIESQKPSTRALNQHVPNVLLVGEDDEDGEHLQGVGGELEAIGSVGIRTTSLVSHEATRANVIKGLQRHGLAHFACHGELQEKRPLDGCFKLHGGERLTMLDIARTRPPNAEVAFLSACHTAEHADTNDQDEVLHLAAAMQHSGFRSVVGTMWAMADVDGPFLAKHFYRGLRGTKGGFGFPAAERSAKSLRDAVQKLRRKRGVTLERWVNFVRFGA
ncbi:CHAT domain-containing protein [Gloeopeniophorella convolvens]|nr:CHAT domain-containing protein [Gloeopeniophorella convolvens]